MIKKHTYILRKLSLTVIITWRSNCKWKYHRYRNYSCAYRIPIVKHGLQIKLHLHVCLERKRRLAEKRVWKRKVESIDCASCVFSEGFRSYNEAGGVIFWCHFFGGNYCDVGLIITLNCVHYWVFFNAFIVNYYDVSLIVILNSYYDVPLIVLLYHNNHWVFKCI